jgi:catechol 2,3-dioxygenase-like lactoylglutathione lyase family enzyme
MPAPIHKPYDGRTTTLTIGRYGTRDLSRATRFYDAIAELLGARRTRDTPTVVCYQGASGVTFVVGLPFEGEPTVGNGVQMGFAAANRGTVDAVHAKALELGGADAGAPGVRGPDPRGFYAAYFRDLDGNKSMVYHPGLGAQQ